MRKFVLIAFSLFLTVLCSDVAFAVNDLLVPTSETGSKQWTHYFTPSFRTRIQYDDNCTASNPKQKSWEALVAPKINLKIPFEKSYVGANWQYTFIGYNQRHGDKADNNQDLDLTLRHDVSDRLTIGVKQFFQYKQQPFIRRDPVNYPGLENTAGNAMMYRFTTPNLSENADYGLYAGTFGADYRFNKKISVDFTYNIERLDFMQETGIVKPSLNYLQHTFMTVLNYRLIPSTVFLVDMRYKIQDYDTIEKDNTSFIIAGGIKNRIGTSVILNGRLGYEHRKPKNTVRLTSVTQRGQAAIPSGDTERGKMISNEPFCEVDMTYLFSRATQIKIGYKLKAVDSEQPSYMDRKLQGVYGALSHKLTSKTYFLLFASQERAYYINYRMVEANDRGATGTDFFEPSETVTKFGFLITQQLKPWMFLELGYRYVDLHSDFSPLGWNEGFGDFNWGGANPPAVGQAQNASYTRNRIFSGVNIIF
ncbi:MAG: outer membrane beta-barrel protein [Candidatus Ancaeobacter aquaticus]|nr:outer membrane beta-barrel protein [Candidatus Ancaeobacter aquaticus]